MSKKLTSNEAVRFLASGGVVRYGSEWSIRRDGSEGLYLVELIGDWAGEFEAFNTLFGAMGFVEATNLLVIYEGLEVYSPDAPSVRRSVPVTKAVQ